MAETFLAARFRFGEYSKEKVDGERVTLEGYEAFAFFVYEHPVYGWYVCEETTGFAVNRRMPERNLAIQDAIQVLKEKGIDGLEKAVEEAKEVQQ